jgi:1,4-alpha-glucan branching enzyme
VQALDYQWADQDWLSERKACPSPYKAIKSIYELHLGSWKRVVDETGSRFMTYRELAD